MTDAEVEDYRQEMDHIKGKLFKLSSYSFFRNPFHVFFCFRQSLSRLSFMPCLMCVLFFCFLVVFVLLSVKGKNVPKPIKNWPQCGVSSKILALLKKHGYEKPTPIQAQVGSQETSNGL